MNAAIDRLLTDRFAQGLAATAGGGLLLRWYVVLVARPTCEVGAPAGDCFQINGDALYSFLQGRMLGDGHLFKHGLEHLATGRVVDSAGDPPLFAMLLGSWSVLGFDTVHWQRFLLTFVGAATIVLIGMLARRLAGDIAGWIAAAIAAAHPLLWINDTVLMSESLYQPVLVIVLLVAVAYADAPTMGRALMVGATIAIASLVRGEAALLGVLLLGPLMLLARELSWTERVRQLLAGGLIAILVIQPVGDPQQRPVRRSGDPDRRIRKRPDGRLL